MGSKSKFRSTSISVCNRGACFKTSYISLIYINIKYYFIFDTAVADKAAQFALFRAGGRKEDLERHPLAGEDVPGDEDLPVGPLAAAQKELIGPDPASLFKSHRRSLSARDRPRRRSGQVRGVSPWPGISRDTPGPRSRRVFGRSRPRGRAGGYGSRRSSS